MRHVAVIDIGKTNAKLLRIDLDTGEEQEIARQPNRVRTDGPYPHYDIPALWAFVLAGLRALAGGKSVDALSITTHGAAAVLVDAAGDLALPALDYEHGGPDETAIAYDACRPPFAETGAPRLPGGLNLGAQLFWQSRRFPEDFARSRSVLMYPQYWAFRLTGVAASEVTSLGCHTDLWQPFAGGLSSMVDSLGWRGLFPPVRGATEVLGTLLPEIARQTGLSATLPVLCGIHDSNASLVPWLNRPGPRAILSTGTWMIVMALQGRRVDLDPARDVLVNVNALGAPVPTARFMAGREFEMLLPDGPVATTPADEDAVLQSRLMALPSLHPATGPFPGQVFAWHPAEPADPAMRTVAASFYVALMGAECLSLIGAEGDIVVEGPLGRNPAFARMLASATGRPVLLAGDGAGTGLGAAMLAGNTGGPRRAPRRVEPEPDPRWMAYAAEWRKTVAARVMP